MDRLTASFSLAAIKSRENTGQNGVVAPRQTQAKTHGKANEDNEKVGLPQSQRFIEIVP